MSHRFLLELGLEEIPAWMIDDASRQLGQEIEKGLKELEVDFQGPPRLYNSPRRLAVAVEGLPERQPDRREVVTGPPKAVAFDDQGNPTQAAEGFAKKMGVDASQLTVEETDKGQYVSCVRTIEGRPLLELLGQVSEQAIRALQWPKNMYWRESRFRFIRPIRWMVALLAHREVDLEVEGVRGGRVTWGHRFLGMQRLVLQNADDYPQRLVKGYVLADPEQRRERIQAGLRQAVPQGLSPLPDEGLMEDVVYLNEYPTVIRGAFDEKYLEIPREVLVTVMRFHQKYFAVVDEEGRLRNYFLTVLNTASDEGGRIRKGHEKVLRARLEDAAFFWDGDRSTPLEERVQALDEVVFQEKLGSYGDKARRLQSLCARLAESWPQLDARALGTAARLCKADLVTDMVKELTELEGIMGGLYAREEGYDEKVHRAIYEHYRPASLEEDIPSSLHGAALSLADKLDTLVGCFGIGMVPKGSRDPFGLRRLAQGIVKILLELGDRVPGSLTLGQLVDWSLQEHQPEEPPDEVRSKLMEFLNQRVRHLFEQQGLAYDVINAVLTAPAQRVAERRRMAEALAAMRSEEDFEALATAFKRIRNILAKAERGLPQVEENLLQEDAEKDLYKHFREAVPQVDQLLQDNDFEAALRRMAALRRPVDRFFDEVMVMTEDERLQLNRLALLDELSKLFLQAADISEIVHKD
ncbi:MAG TPA: glycine--tRNA ligase subunit beta [Acidobacteriota bacterium]|nr:glycine--tRNA ligase subunit beta [Acidobacteriota bacterium]